MLRTSTTHKYLSSLTQAAAPGVHLPAHPALPGSLGWGGPSCRDGASHARMQDSVAQPGRRAPQPAGAPSPTQGSPPAPGGHRGLPPWGNSWDGGSHERGHPKDPPWPLLTPHPFAGRSLPAGLGQGRAGRGPPPGDPSDTPPSCPASIPRSTQPLQLWVPAPAPSPPPEQRSRDV